MRELCTGFPDEHRRDLGARREYPEEFVRAMTEAGYLAALIPEEYGGMGLEGGWATLPATGERSPGGAARATPP